MARVIADDVDFDAYLRDENDGRADVRPASEYLDEVVRYFHGDREEAGGVQTPWPSVGDNLAFRPGEVSLWAGVNGHGKSGVLGYAMLHAMTTGERACIASMEMPPRDTMQRLCRQASAGGCPSIDFIEKFHKWTDDRLWLYAHQGVVRSERMIAVARYCRKELGVTHMVIDSLMKCGINPDDYNAQKNFVDALCVLARDTGLHIHLVHHIRKGDTEKAAPDKFDIKGAGEITDLVDNVLIVFRNKRKETALESRKLTPEKREEVLAEADTIVICDKQRHFTWEGRIALWFDKASQQLLDQRQAGRQYIDFASGQWARAWSR